MTPGSRARLAFAAAGATLLAACSSGADEPSTPRGEATYSAAPAGPSAGPSAAAGGKPDLSAPQTIATGLDVPWGLAFLPDGAALVSERQTGRILRIPPGGGNPQTVYEVAGVTTGGEGGLLGIAVDPEYAVNKYVYAYFTAADDNRIVRFTLGSRPPKVIFDGLVKGSRHNGGRIAFGPDGMLYVGTGDASDEDLSQDPKSINGKILRLTREGAPAPGNPTEGSPVWSTGHRNVQGLAWDARGKMYATEFGQEVNVIEPGKNYGWPVVEGRSDSGRYVNPIAQWRTDDASPSGAAIAGDTLYVAALKGERLWTVPLAGGEPRVEFAGKYGRLRAVAVAPDGSLWLTTSNRDGRGDPHSGDDRILRFPATT
jgi:glucose/arabinose dehydrogenase